MAQQLAPLLASSDSEEINAKLRSLYQVDLGDNTLISRGAVPGYCLVCEREVRFIVDERGGGSASEPNWRETMVCPGCRLANRQRLMAALALDSLAPGGTAYLMEHTSPLYYRLVARLPPGKAIGSEYFPGHEPGATVGALDYVMPFNPQQPIRWLWQASRLFVRMLRGLRHEDVCDLSFPDRSIDLVLSNDVFEHVPAPETAFRECARVLRPGGTMLATFPVTREPVSVQRAEILDGEISFLQPPVYHGNPMSSEGALVFTDFGWDVIAQMRSAGFTNVVVELYREPQFGHTGPPLIVFRAER